MYASYLADELAALQSARQSPRPTDQDKEGKTRIENKVHDKEEETRLENKVKQTRKEIDEIGGWYYGRKDAPAVA